MIRALLGGTFDPFHVGHLSLVNYILQQQLAAAVQVVPAGQSPHKQRPALPGRHRLRMAEAAFADQCSVTVDPREIERGGISYTVDTMAELCREFPQDSWLLVIGSDNIEAFFEWREPERLLDLADLLIFARDGWSGELPPKLATRAQVVLDFACPISATALRKELDRGRVPIDALPDVVTEYIVANKLYGLGE